MATLSSILAWRIPWTKEPGGRVAELDMTEQLMLSLSSTFHSHFLSFLSFFFFAMPRGMQSLSSLARDRSHASCSGNTEP